MCCTSKYTFGQKVNFQHNFYPLNTFGVRAIKRIREMIFVMKTLSPFRRKFTGWMAEALNLSNFIPVVWIHLIFLHFFFSFSATLESGHYNLPYFAFKDHTPANNKADTHTQRKKERKERKSMICEIIYNRLDENSGKYMWIFHALLSENFQRISSVNKWAANMVAGHSIKIVIHDDAQKRKKRNVFFPLKAFYAMCRPGNYLIYEADRSEYQIIAC